LDREAIEVLRAKIMAILIDELPLIKEKSKMKPILKEKQTVIVILKGNYQIIYK
jgi:hypothetical protein